MLGIGSYTLRNSEDIFPLRVELNKPFEICSLL